MPANILNEIPHCAVCLCTHRTSLDVRFISQCDVRGACECVCVLSTREKHISADLQTIFDSWLYNLHMLLKCGDKPRNTVQDDGSAKWGVGRVPNGKTTFYTWFFDCCVQAQNRWTHHTRYLPYEICFCSCCCCRELPTAGLEQRTNLNNWRNKFYCNMCFDFISVTQCNTPTKLQFYPMRRRGTLSGCCTYQYYVYLAKLMQTSLSCNK